MCRPQRWVVFFTVSPLFEEGDCGEIADEAFDGTLGEYDPEAQIHAGWLIWRAGAVLGDTSDVIREYDGLGYELLQFGVQGEKMFKSFRGGKDDEEPAGGGGGGRKRKHKGSGTGKRKRAAAAEAGPPSSSSQEPAAASAAKPQEAANGDRKLA